MATRNSTRTSDRIATRAVAYIRRSTTRQEQSLGGQRADIERFAAENGYEIVRWYEDDGISGDATEKRTGFLKMHSDAQNGRDFDVIICWDYSRFGRFDSIEAGRWIDPLRRAGVKLVTIKEGLIDWTGFEGRVMNALHAEGKHQYLLGLAESASRGLIQRAQQGHLCGQAAPYGYDRMLVDENGKHRQRVRNGEQFAKPRSWHVTLVLSDDPQKVKTVKWLFKQYAETDIGLRALCDSLNERSIPSPGGGAWWVGTIREILRNPAYTGDFVWAKRRMGKYRRVAGTNVKKREDVAMTDGGNVSVRRNAPEEWIVARDAHPAIISRSTFEAIQEKLTERKKRTSSYKKTNGERYLLSGLVRCAHCGAKMYGSRLTRKKNGKTHVYFKYECSTYKTQGKTQCGHNAVPESLLTDFLIAKLREMYLCDNAKDDLRKAIRKQLAAESVAAPVPTADLRAKLAELESAVANGTKRLLAASDDVADLLAGELTKMRRERDRIAGELQKVAVKPTKGKDVEAQVEAAVARLWTLAADLDRTKPERLREVFRRMVDSIDLYFDRQKTRGGIRTPLAKGIIGFRRDSLLSPLVSRDGGI
ncbi:MAG: recombinase family protein [Phycisphaerae bacterium]